MPPTAPYFAPMMAILRSGGDTDIAVAVTAALGVAGITAWHHWKKVEEPGHFDHIDAECAERAGLTQEQIDHLDRDVPRGLKERMRRFFLSRNEDVEVVAKNLPLPRGEEESYLDVKSGAGKITLVARTPFR